ncbi:DNA polymerase III PolC-type-like [Solenopsis invicta]|uniref:DNA polymerase III PolC-type-like n=1 Tax=Solenopsis invicta TaxID=13686 RepID=UPI00193EAC5C|nr:DNA polymerase III PolC-type-like [Solenopsis invicta]
MVFFNLETSGLNATADILQIAAKSGNYIFNVYIEPLQEICTSATKITGLHSIGPKLYYHNKLLETCTQENALQAFNLFLKKLATRCLLVAHNASFDIPRLLRLILKHDMIEPFYVISGFSDSLAVLKKALPDRKGPGKFKLSTLYNDFLTTDDVDDSDKMFHNAEFDVVALEKLVLHFQVEEKLFLHAKTLQVKLLSEKVDGKARVTKNKKVLNKIIHHIVSLL